VSLKMNCRAFTERTNVFAWYKNIWLDEGWS
jgi:hypothetical protein